jgi:hypothetical protein
VIFFIIGYMCVLSFQMRSCTADAITAKLKTFLEEHNLDINKLAGFGSDGASTMVGRRNGVATQLKRVSIKLKRVGD